MPSSTDSKDQSNGSPNGNRSNLTSQGSKVLSSPAPEWSSATQDIVHSLPKVWTRGLLYVLFISIGVILPWAMFSSVDQTGSARGRLEPLNKTYRIDAPVSGKVTTLSVKEGSPVKAGQPILELASELVKADLLQAEAKLEGQLNRLTQLEQTKNQVEIASRTQKLQNQAQMAEQEAQVNQSQRQVQSSQQAVTLAEERWQKDQREVERYRKLFRRRVIPEVKLVEIQRTADESNRQLEQSKANVQQAIAELVKQQKAVDRVARTGELTTLANQKQVKEVQAQISDARAEIAQTRQLITSLKLQLQQRTIKSPINGSVFQLSVSQPGAVLQAGQMVVQIAARGAPLILRAQMPSAESGFLRVGMPVKLKFDAYPFQEYGIIPARLTKISPDSKVTRGPQGEVEAFELEITLEQTCIRTRDRCIPILPGQTATAEVVVRQRRIIDFFLDPFKKLQQGDLEL